MELKIAATWPVCAKTPVGSGIAAPSGAGVGEAVGAGLGAGVPVIVTCVAPIALDADPMPPTLIESPTVSVPPETVVEDVSAMGSVELPVFSVNPYAVAEAIVPDVDALAIGAEERIIDDALSDEHLVPVPMNSPY